MTTAEFLQKVKEVENGVAKMLKNETGYNYSVKSKRINTLTVYRYGGITSLTYCFSATLKWEYTDDDESLYYIDYEIQEDTKFRACDNTACFFEALGRIVSSEAIEASLVGAIRKIERLRFNYSNSALSKKNELHEL